MEQIYRVSALELPEDIGDGFTFVGSINRDGSLRYSTPYPPFLTAQHSLPMEYVPM